MSKADQIIVDDVVLDNETVNEMFNEASDKLQQLLPPEEFGENPDCETIWYILSIFRDGLVLCNKSLSSQF